MGLIAAGHPGWAIVRLGSGYGDQQDRAAEQAGQGCGGSAVKTECTFTVESFEPVDWVPEITTGLATGHAHLTKTYTGGLVGRSITQFSSSFDAERGFGTYLALESFEGTLDGKSGAFNYAHSATTDGSPDRLHEFFLIVPSSGSGELAGLSGTGKMIIDDDGTHRLEIDYTL